jgi:hypothetical protein
VWACASVAALIRLGDVPDGVNARLRLYGVARHVLANHRRGERRRTALSDRLRADLVTYRAREYSGELAGITVAFRRLPAADQELLALAAWEGLTTGQIEAVLGCSPNAVRIRRHSPAALPNSSIASTAAEYARARRPAPDSNSASSRRSMALSAAAAAYPTSSGLAAAFTALRSTGSRLASRSARRSFRALAERRRRETRAEQEPLDEWPDGPPAGDSGATKRYDAALRPWPRDARRPYRWPGCQGIFRIWTSYRDGFRKLTAI